MALSGSHLSLASESPNGESNRKTRDALAISRPVGAMRQATALPKHLDGGQSDLSGVCDAPADVLAVFSPSCVR
jgi:hypothetical protein